MFYSSDVSDVFLQSIFKLNDEKKLSYKYYNKGITTRDNGQSDDKEESKLNSSITTSSGAHTLTNDQIIKKAHTIRIT